MDQELIQLTKLLIVIMVKVSKLYSYEYINVTYMLYVI